MRHSQPVFAPKMLRKQNGELEFAAKAYNVPGLDYINIMYILPRGYFNLYIYIYNKRPIEARVICSWMADVTVNAATAERGIPIFRALAQCMSRGWN